ncbi:MAG: hypothetical protein ACTS5I_12285, partial [Rhodanobacter sp.]
MGRLLFGYFLLAKQEKVTSRRATPGDLVWFKKRNHFAAIATGEPSRNFSDGRTTTFSPTATFPITSTNSPIFIP